MKWRSPRQDVALRGVKRIHTNTLCVRYCLDGSLQAHSCLINSIHHPRDSGEGAQSQEGRVWSPEPKSTAKERSERKDILAHPLVSFHALWHLGRNKSFYREKAGLAEDRSLLACFAMFSALLFPHRPMPRRRVEHPSSLFFSPSFFSPPFL